MCVFFNTRPEFTDFGIKVSDIRTMFPQLSFPDRVLSKPGNLSIQLM